jgi:hypothetical protein
MESFLGVALLLYVLLLKNWLQMHVDCATLAAMDRPGIHEIPKARVLARLREMGLPVTESNSTSRYDFLLNGRVRVALRTAFPSSYRRRVRLRRRRYSYVYRAWNFNFHHRGRIEEQYCDFFICVPLGMGKSLDLSTAYIIPWDARSGKTFYLPDSQHAYAGKYAEYRDAWHQLHDSCSVRAA